MNRIIIIGCPGSGKTTLARQLSHKLKLPLVHLDKIFWTGNWEHLSREEFDKLLLIELQKPQWVIDGNFNRSIPTRLQYCDTVIYLDFPQITCIISVLKRVIFSYGKTRPDMGGNCPEKFDLEFLKLIWNFNKEHKRNYYQTFKSIKNKQVIILNSRKKVKDFISSI